MGTGGHGNALHRLTEIKMNGHRASRVTSTPIPPPPLKALADTPATRTSDCSARVLLASAISEICCGSTYIM